MPKEKNPQPTRQLFAKIREDVYLDAKAKSAELRVPLREFLENALISALRDEPADPPQPPPAAPPRSIWDDEYLSMQSRQPFGSPVELTGEEAAAILQDAIKPASDKSAESGDMDDDDYRRRR